MSTTYSSFLSLPCALTSSDFQAIPLSNTRKDFLAKNDKGAPVFLLHDASLAQYNPGINFRYLSAQFHATCRINTDHDQIEDQFCIILCDAEAPELHELFIRCISAAIENLPEKCTTRELEVCISQLRDLFRSLAQPSRREISGLWAELFVILNCGNPLRALSSWHEDQFDRFDFSNESLRVEVKSTVRNVRAHEFSLEQLQAPKNGKGFIISILLQPLTGGIGVLDLARAVETKAKGYPHLKQKLWENVAQTLGTDFSDRLDKRFDEAFAERGLMVFTMHDIPCPNAPADPRVSELRFVSDLTSVFSSLPASAGINMLSIFSRGDSDGD